MGLMTAVAPLRTRRLWAARERFPVVAPEPWGWAGVVVIEAFGSEAGDRWMGRQAIGARMAELRSP